LEDSDTTAAEKSTIRNYISTLRNLTGAGRLKDKEPNPSLLQYGAYDYDKSPIFDTNAEGTLYSMKLQLSYIQLAGQTGEMKQKKDRDLWNQSIMPYLRALGTNPNFVANPAYQKRQFIALHDEIMSFLATSLVGVHKETYNLALSTQAYLKQLNSIGFDVRHENVFRKQDL